MNGTLSDRSFCDVDSLDEEFSKKKSIFERIDHSRDKLFIEISPDFYSENF